MTDREKIIYESQVPLCNAEPMGKPSITLTEMMGEANGLGKEALIMAKVISKHFFGDNAENPQLERKSNCYYDVMVEHCDILKELCETLHIVCGKLGCDR